MFVTSKVFEKCTVSEWVKEWFTRRLLVVHESGWELDDSKGCHLTIPSAYRGCERPSLHSLHPINSNNARVTSLGFKSVRILIYTKVNSLRQYSPVRTLGNLEAGPPWPHSTLTTYLHVKLSQSITWGSPLFCRTPYPKLAEYPR